MLERPITVKPRKESFVVLLNFGHVMHRNDEVSIPFLCLRFLKVSYIISRSSIRTVFGEELGLKLAFVTVFPFDDYLIKKLSNFSTLK